MSVSPTRILVIPHQPHRHIRVRATEIARHLAGKAAFEIYLLSWELPQTARMPGKLPIRLGEALRSVKLAPEITRIETGPEAGIRRVRLPYCLLPGAQGFNRIQIARFVREHGIQTIISANAAHFPMPEPAEAPGVTRIYDVVDDHISAGSGPQWRRTRAFTLNELRKADQILAVSHALCDLLAEVGFPDGLRVPNGVDLQAIRRPSETAVRAIRDQYDLDGRFTVGYIGNHGDWAGIDLLITAFQRMQQRMPASRLLIVGPVENLPRYERLAANNPDIVFTGFVSPEEIPAWFHAIDLGVLPARLGPFKDNAMPLKILDYGAARKQTLATPLKELQTLAFPHVTLLEPHPTAWGEALIRFATERPAWKPAWDSVIEAYDWPQALAPLDALLHPLEASFLVDKVTTDAAAV